jgi:rhodanese-related sulfurtransferase
MFNLFGKEDFKSVNVNDLDKLIGKIELIDIRETYEYAGGSIQTAKNIPMGDLLSEPEKYLSKEKTYYILCQSGARSARTTGSLAKQGYNAVNVSGGMGSYFGKNRA